MLCAISWRIHFGTNTTDVWRSQNDCPSPSRDHRFVHPPLPLSSHHREPSSIIDMLPRGRKSAEQLNAIFDAIAPSSDDPALSVHSRVWSHEDTAFHDRPFSIRI